MNTNIPGSWRINFRMTILAFLLFEPSFLQAATEAELLHQLNNQQVRNSAAEQLWRRGSSAAVKPLFEILNREIDNNPNVFSCHWLGRMFRSKKDPGIETQINAGTLELIEYYHRSDTPRSNKLSIIQCLGSIGSPVALPLLHQRIQENQDGGFPFGAVGEIDSPNSIPVIKKAIDGRRPHGHPSAVKALSEMHSREAAEALKDICADPRGSVCDKHPDPRVRKRISEVLKREERVRLRIKEIEDRNAQHAKP